eukprot:scaffold3127_cov202-Prasinococcus_capsulatus_cf.AAC.12
MLHRRHLLPSERLHGTRGDERRMRGFCGACRDTGTRLGGGSMLGVIRTGLHPPRRVWSAYSASTTVVKERWRRRGACTPTPESLNLVELYQRRTQIEV